MIHRDLTISQAPITYTSCRCAFVPINSLPSYLPHPSIMYCLFKVLLMTVIDADRKYAS